MNKGGGFVKFVLIFGDSAVGKMTVGQELTKITDLRLFHNHMMIEPVLDIFGSFHIDTILKLRKVIFESFAKTDHEGLIHTFMWAFDHEEDWAYVQAITDIFKSVGATIYYVELFAPLEIRLKRNTTENRLKHKASKRDLEASEKRLIQDTSKARLVSHDGEIPFENYLKIDNSNLSASDVAKMIKNEFKL